MEPERHVSSADNGKTAAVIGYLSIVGWLIAYFVFHNEKKTALGSYHLRQTLLYYIICLAIYMIWPLIVVTFLSSFSLSFARFAAALSWVLCAAAFVLWIIGLIGAVNGEKKPIPFIGDRAQSMFKGI